jgi:hypothetical protein
VIYIYVYYIYVYTYIYIYMYVFLYMYIYINKCIYKYTYMYINIHMIIYSYIYVYMHVYICILIHTTDAFSMNHLLLSSFTSRQLARWFQFSFRQKTTVIPQKVAASFCSCCSCPLGMPIK